MSKTTILFLCRDNALLGPLAEAYLNARGGALVRAFSAGLQPAAVLHPDVSALLAETGVSGEGLSPKSFEVFTMPHAPLPDEVVCLEDDLVSCLPSRWQGHVPVSHWKLALTQIGPRSLATASGAFKQIKGIVDQTLAGKCDQPQQPYAHCA